MDSVDAVTTLSPLFLAIYVANTWTDQIHGATIGTDQSNIQDNLYSYRI